MAKRGRKPSTKRKGYFFETEETAVKQYLQATTKEEKDYIYEQILRPAFDKMISSIIRRYHLYVPDEEYEQTFNDTLSYMLTKMSNFKPEKGYKAYSYCGTIAKNYLKAKNIQYSKNKERNIPYDDVFSDIYNDAYYSSASDETTFKKEAPGLLTSTAQEIEKMISEPEKNNLNENEVRVGIALIELLNNWEEIFIDDGSSKLNKSSVLYFLREETMMTTKEVRDNMKKYKVIYKMLRDEALS
jgi:hypothetical protein